MGQSLSRCNADSRKSKYLVTNSVREQLLKRRPRETGRLNAEFLTRVRHDRICFAETPNCHDLIKKLRITSHQDILGLSLVSSTFIFL